VPRPAPVLAAFALCLVLAGGGYLISQSGGTGVVSTSSAAGSAASQSGHKSAAVARPGIIAEPKVTAGAPPYKVIFTNTDYLPATLRAHALSELSSLGSSRGTSPSIALQACVMQVVLNDTPAFVDVARYEGKPATVIVAQDHAWVTSKGCNATQHDVLDSVSLSGG
jgi:hypothetical protein